MRRDHKERLYLNNDEYIEFPVQAHPANASCFKDILVGYDMSIYFCRKNNFYRVCGDTEYDVWCAIIDCKFQLEEVLKGEREIRPNWENKIGYLWNEYHKFASDESELNIRSPRGDWWLGSEYTMWNNPHMSVTLLYTHKENIIFEIVPLYSRKTYLVPYNIFIKNYRSYARQIISRDVAEDWLRKVTEITVIMFKN